MMDNFCGLCRVQYVSSRGLKMHQRRNKKHRELKVPDELGERQEPSVRD